MVIPVYTNIGREGRKRSELEQWPAKAKLLFFLSKVEFRSFLLDNSQQVMRQYAFTHFLLLSDRHHSWRRQSLLPYYQTTCNTFSYTAEKKKLKGFDFNFHPYFLSSATSFLFTELITGCRQTRELSLAPSALFLFILISFSRFHSSSSPALSIFCHAADFSFASPSISASHCSSPSISPRAFVSFIPSSFCQRLFPRLPSAASETD